MTYYYWFLIKPLPDTNFPDLLHNLAPLSVQIEPLKSGMFSILLSSTTEPGQINTWIHSVPWYRFGWVNECMRRPASLGYVHTLESFNAFVNMYMLTYANQKLTPLEAQ